MQRTLAVVASTVALTAATSVPAQSAPTNTVAHWVMNEPAGATVMTDASGNPLDGAIGSAVHTGVLYDGATGYQWLFTKPNAEPVKPERLVQVPDSQLLDPGGNDYAVTLRYRTTQAFGNIVQKGQAGSAGGYWKLQAPQGVLGCLFRGADGSRSVNSGTALNDGVWHTVRCERTVDRVTMTIDGIRTRTTFGATGSIDNKKPLTIGGKANCDQITVTCDYFTGMIDYVKIES